MLRVSELLENGADANARLTYTIIDGNDNNLFRIDANSGTIRILPIRDALLDSSAYLTTLTVQVRAGNYSDTLQLHIVPRTATPEPQIIKLDSLSQEVLLDINDPQLGIPESAPVLTAQGVGVIEEGASGTLTGITFTLEGDRPPYHRQQFHHQRTTRRQI